MSKYATDEYKDKLEIGIGLIERKSIEAVPDAAMAEAPDPESRSRERWDQLNREAHVVEDSHSSSEQHDGSKARNAPPLIGKLHPDVEALVEDVGLSLGEIDMSEENKDRATGNALGKLHVAFLRADRDDEFKRHLMAAAGIKPRKNTSLALAVVRAGLSGSPRPSSTVNDYSRALRAFKLENVGETVKEVGDWWEGKDQNGGAELRGYKRVKAVLASDPTARVDPRKDAREQKKERRLADLVASLERTDVHTFNLRDHARSNCTGPVFVLARLEGNVATVFPNAVIDKEKVLTMTSEQK